MTIEFKRMTDHKLEVKRNVDGFINHLYDAKGVDETEEEAYTGGFLPAGSCGHLVDGVFTLGCEGFKLPYLLFRNTNAPMNSSLGSDPFANSSRQGGSVTGGARNFAIYSCQAGFDVSSTRFDQARTYAEGDALISPETDTTGDAKTAGLVTNEGAKHGRTTIVGVVTKAYNPGSDATKSKDYHKNYALHFRTCWFPALQEVDTAIVQA